MLATVLRPLPMIVLLAACGAAETPAPVPTPTPPPAPAPAPAAEASPPAPVTLSIVGTNDVHGRVASVAVLAGFVDNLRRARESDGGAVLLVDGGDMWQGTLESNLGEGRAMVTAYNMIGYTAATIGNHEFDYGPVGDAATPRGPGDDRRGALKARVREARFPILAANLLDDRTGEQVRWESVRPSVLHEAAGVTVGIIGVTTEETLRTTIAGNVDDLRMASVRDTVVTEARALRERGARVIVVAAHAGGICNRFDDPDDLSACDPAEEIFELAHALPEGTVDVIVAGHTHAGVAHRVRGIAIIEQYAQGYAFGRVDLTYDPVAQRVTDSRIFPPQPLCTRRAERLDDCAPGEYEGRPVEPDRSILEAVASDLSRAQTLRDQPLGVTLTSDIRRSRDAESALGNLLTDLMRRARPSADVAIINGGGIRASFDEGPLTYGQLYETFPFDNRFAVLRMSGAELRAVFARMLGEDGAVLIPSGLRVVARCRRGRLDVTLRRDAGRAVRDSEQLEVLLSDYLATSAEPTFAAVRERPGALSLEDEPPIREELARVLRERGGTLDAGTLLRPRHRRIDFPGDRRPVSCE